MCALVCACVWVYGIVQNALRIGTWVRTTDTSILFISFLFFFVQIWSVIRSDCIAVITKWHYLCAAISFMNVSASFQFKMHDVCDMRNQCRSFQTRKKEWEGAEERNSRSHKPEHDSAALHACENSKMTRFGPVLIRCQFDVRMKCRFNGSFFFSFLLLPLIMIVAKQQHSSRKKKKR